MLFHRVKSWKYNFFISECFVSLVSDPKWKTKSTETWCRGQRVTQPLGRRDGEEAGKRHRETEEGLELVKCSPWRVDESVCLIRQKEVFPLVRGRKKLRGWLFDKLPSSWHDSLYYWNYHRTLNDCVVDWQMSSQKQRHITLEFQMTNSLIGWFYSLEPNVTTLPYALKIDFPPIKISWIRV